MRKIFVSLVLASVVVSTPALSAECRPARDYKLSGLSFPKMPLDSALQKVLAGSPLSPKLSNDANNIEVSADNVSGSADAALDDLARSTGNKWTQDGCVVRISPIPKQATLPQWGVKSGETLESVIRRWVTPDGWQVVWDIQEIEALHLMADASFTGTLEEAVERLSDALALSGEQLIFTFHQGNKVLRVSRVK